MGFVTRIGGFSFAGRMRLGVTLRRGCNHYLWVPFSSRIPRASPWAKISQSFGLNTMSARATPWEILAQGEALGMRELNGTQR